MPLQRLQNKVVHSICSGQVITSISSIVKELLENSLDANATSIDVTLQDDGLSSIRVNDNGSGISSADAHFVAQRYHTSKISLFKDLDNVSTFGFRGEAVHSICNLSEEISIITKMESETVGRKYTFKHNGEVNTVTQIASSTGTTVLVTKPFIHIPVRRQLMAKDPSAIRKNLIHMLTLYAIIIPNLRIVLKNEKLLRGSKPHCPILWQKISCKSHLESIQALFGHKVANQLQMDQVDIIDSNEKLGQLLIIIPKIDSDHQLVNKVSPRPFYFVNRRPVSNIDFLGKIFKEHYNLFCGSLQVSSVNLRSPFLFIHCILEPSKVDVNIEPSKEAVLIHAKDAVKRIMSETLHKLLPITNTTSAFEDTNNSNGSDLDNVENNAILNLCQNQSQSKNNIIPKNYFPKVSKTANDLDDVQPPAILPLKRMNTTSNNRVVLKKTQLDHSVPRDNQSSISLSPSSCGSLSIDEDSNVPQQSVALECTDTGRLDTEETTYFGTTNASPSSAMKSQQDKKNVGNVIIEKQHTDLLKLWSMGKIPGLESPSKILKPSPPEGKPLYDKKKPIVRLNLQPSECDPSLVPLTQFWSVLSNPRDTISQKVKIPIEFLKLEVDYRHYSKAKHEPAKFVSLREQTNSHFNEVLTEVGRVSSTDLGSATIKQSFLPNNHFHLILTKESGNSCFSENEILFL